MIASSKSFCPKIKFLKPFRSCVYALFVFAFPIPISDFRFPIDEPGRRAEINSDHTFGILLVLGGFIMTDHRKSGS